MQNPNNRYRGIEWTQPMTVINSYSNLKYIVDKGSLANMQAE